MIRSSTLSLLDPPEALIRLAGDLDLDGHQGVTEAARSALDAGCRCLVFDVSHVTFADASALGAFVRIRNDVCAAGGFIRLVGAPEPFARVLHITALEQALGAA